MQKPSHTETSTMDQLQQYSDHVDVKEEIDGQQEVEIPTPETTEQHNHQDIKDEEELHSDSGSKSLLYDKQQECVKTDDDDDDGNVYESKQQIRFLTHEVDASDLHLEDSGRQLTSADANGETSLNEESGLMEVDKGDVDTDESRSNDGGNNEHSHRHRSLDYDENVMDESEDGNQSDVPIMNEETDIVPNSEYQPNLIPITNATTTTALVVSSISSTSSGSSIAYPQLTMINVATNDVTSGQLPMNATNQVTPQDQSALPENIANQNVLRSGRVSVPPVRLGFEVPESSKKRKNNKIPTCSECGYSNVDPENVSRHIWRVHFDQIDTTNPVDSIEDMQPSVTEPASTSPKPIVEPMLSNTVTSNEHQQSLHNQVLEQIGDSTDHSVNVMTGTVASYTQFQPATSQQASCEDKCVLPNLENRIEEINQLYTNNSNESTVKPNEQSLVLRSAFTLVIPSKAIVKSDEQKVKIINAECDDSDRECMITDESIQINGTEQINPLVLLNDSQGGTSYIHSVQTEEQIDNHKEIEIPVSESAEQLQHKVIKKEEADWTSSGSSSTLPPATETEPSSTQSQPSTSQLPSAEGCIKPKKEEEDDDDKKFEFEWDECDCADCRPAREIKIEFCQTHGIPTSMVSSSVELKCNNAAHCKRSLRPCKRVKKEEEEEQNRVIKIELPDGECEVKQENEQTEDKQIVPASNEAGIVQIRAGGDGRAGGEVSDDDKTEVAEDENELRDTDDLRDGGQIDAQDGLDDGDDSDSESNSSDDEEEDGNEDESLEDMEVDDDDDEVAQDVTDEEKSDEEETEIDEAEDLNESDAQDGNEIEENGNELNDLVDQRRSEEGAQERGEGDDDASGSDSPSDDDQTEMDEDEVQEPEPGQLSRKKKHICEHCGKGFRYPSILNLHIRTHTGEKPFECSWTGCGKVFAANNKLKAHFCTHTGEKPFKCSWIGCSKVFAANRDLKVHFCTHTGEKPFKCSWIGCGKAFAANSKLKAHFCTHTRENTFKCSWESCSKTFTAKRYLKAHLRIHTGDRLIKCSWDGCNLTFIFASKMKKHLRTHSERRSIECTWAGCTETFTEKSGLDVHLIKIHEEKKPFKCTWENCDKTFALKDYLRAHLKYHQGLYAFACEQCENKYMYKFELVQHNQTHTGERPYKCSWSDCTKEFTKKCLLDQHYQYHVNKSKLPYKCTWPKCQKAFSLNELMDKHFNIHKKQQNFPFSCDQCARKFKTSYKLKVHTATHSSERNFVCTFGGCKKKFKFQFGLAYHLKKHN